jgi:Flp pilus assembly protein TadG
VRRLRKFSNGQGATELALALPLVVVLLFVVCQFARVFYVAIGLASAARAGVQYGAQSYVKAIDTAGMNAAATNDGKNIPGISASSTHFCMCDGSQCSPSQSNPLRRFLQRAALYMHRAEGVR